MKRARILKPDPESLAMAADAIRHGEVVGMPTETVYGLAGNALDPSALARVFETKERPTFDPLIIHVGFMAKSIFALGSQLGLVDLKKLSPAAMDRAEKLIQSFWPGPLTLVLPKTDRVPDLATSGLQSVAIRMPRHPVAQQLIAAAGVPIAAPSANRFGRISPTSAQAVMDELGDRIDLILDGGSCEIGLESTVIRVEEDGALTLLRPGGISPERIAEVTGVMPARPQSEPKLEGSLDSPVSVGGLAAPGMLKSHYAPRKPLFLLNQSFVQISSPSELPVAPGKRIAALAFSGSEDEVRLIFSRLTSAPVDVRVLSPMGIVEEAAQRLFTAMRELDATDAEQIYAEPCPVREGLGHAIADRLHRAATNTK